MTRIWSALLAAALAACQPAGQEPDGQEAETAEPASDGSLCQAEPTPITDVQGNGFASPISGQDVTVRGVVTLARPGHGLFIQEALPLAPGPASRGLFIVAPELAAVSARGALIAIAGTVGEIGERDDTITALVTVETHEVCGEGPEPPVFDARLPLTPGEREGFEAMQVLLEQSLTITEARDVPRGEITVSALGLLRAPTEVGLPGPEAMALEHKNRNWSLPVRNDQLRDLEPYTRVHAGAVVYSLNGVLGHDGRQISLLTDGDLVAIARPVPQVPQAADGAIRVASFNLHEYFNGDGRGGGFPGERGADSAREFERQSARIVAAIAEIGPDILAVQELENDGFGPQSAVRHLKSALSEAMGADFAVADPQAERAGSDVISVGLLFRPDRVAAQGPARLLEGGSFGPLNRVPLAQRFSDRSSGERFLVVSNHLKSKGYCPESGPDTDQGDGQACWNPTRLEGALETLNWARTLAAESGTSHILLVGDFNAYRLEDPVRALLGEGLVELVAHHEPELAHYSYIYRGAAGTLDYAFASESLAEASTGAFIWHINAAYPWSSRPSEPWLRSSDHDPVVVDLRFSQPATSD